MHAISVQPIEDELLYSVLARSKELLGVRHSASFLRFGSAEGPSTFRIGLPDRLDAIANALPGRSLTALQLIEQHTVLPYFSRFMSREQHGRVVAAMRDSWQRGGYNGLGYMHGTETWPKWMRFCPNCVTADLLEGQTPGWRRMHQLPGVFVCPDHGASLRAGHVALASQSRLVACPDDPDAGSQVNCPIDAVAALRIARGSQWLLMNPGSPVERTVLQTAMRALLAERDWLGSNGLARPGFVNALEESYGREVLAGLGVAFSSKRSRKAGQRLWGRAQQPRVAPLACLLTLNFLELDVAELFSRCGLPKRGASVRTQARPNPRPTTLARHRAALTQLMFNNPDLSRKELRRVCNISYCYLGRNDPAWLDSSLPPKRRIHAAIDWQANDRHLAPLAVAAVQGLRCSSGRPVRLTFARIAYTLGLRTTLFRRDARLPMTLKVMTEGVETNRSFRERQLQWAATYFRQRRIFPTWSSFIRKAGYKTCTWPDLEGLARHIRKSCSDPDILCSQRTRAADSAWPNLAEVPQI